MAQLPRLTARRAGVLPSEDAGQEPTSRTIPPIDADLAELIAYAARRLEIRRIIIPSANLAGTTIPTGVEVIGLGRIDELLNQ